MKKIDKLIEIIRENMVVSGGVPTNNISSGNIAKFDPVFDLRRRNTKGWNIFFKRLVKQQRKKKKK